MACQLLGSRYGYYFLALAIPKLIGPTKGETDDWQRAPYEEQARVSRFWGWSK